MQSETAQEFKTVYENAGFTLNSESEVADQMLFQIYACAHQHYACSGLLRLDARVVHHNGLAAFRMTCMDMEAIFDAIKKFCKLDQITKIEMRLNAQEFDRWIAVPKDMTLIRVHELDCFGMRWEDGRQGETADARAINLSENFAAYRHRITHVYFPGADDLEIPIYPCEPFGVKKVDLKSSSQTDLGKAEVEPQSDPVKADREASAPKINVDTKAALSSLGRVLGKLFGPISAEEIDRAVAEGNMRTVKFDSIPSQRELHAKAKETCENAVAKHTELKSRSREIVKSIRWPLPHHIPSFDAETQAAVTETAQTTMKELAAMCDASADRLKYATVAQLQNPATLKALFDHLRNEGDRETLTALFRLSSAALTAMRFQEALGKTATGKPSGNKGGEHL